MTRLPPGLGGAGERRVEDLVLEATQPQLLVDGVVESVRVRAKRPLLELQPTRAEA
jgi:hypothetical protein